MFFIDESGSMPKQKDIRFKNRYFVITFVQTEDPKKLSNTYKHAINTLKSKFPSFFAGLNNPNEMKGSEAHPFMKLYILDRLFKSTDIRIGHVVVDNWNIDQKFRNIPGRSFNYLIKLIIENFPLTINDRNLLCLRIDNRNTALEELRELEGYLYNQLVLDTGLLNSVAVEYLESKDHRGIQVADIISHIIYQRFRYKTLPFPNFNSLSKDDHLMHPYTYEFLYNFMRKRIVVPYVFPPTTQAIAESAASFVL